VNWKPFYPPACRSTGQGDLYLKVTKFSSHSCQQIILIRRLVTIIVTGDLKKILKKKKIPNRVHERFFADDLGRFHSTFKIHSPAIKLSVICHLQPDGDVKAGRTWATVKRARAIGIAFARPVSSVFDGRPLENLKKEIASTAVDGRLCS